ncbi:MAG: glycosyltransferase [Ferrovibrio sp.]|uniref:glycosyltransferase family protein n=1 Tax=Ferrovibrio sp. TaxID=1917215 RepID=UPI0026108B57|nr:glycosyltransferase [Ferrovibrio sp.]MCW0235403.1 glycosyltransferase [Ferrovibrio sp.]
MSGPVSILALAASASPTLAIHLLRPLHGLPGFDIQMLTQDGLAQIVKGAPSGIDAATLAGLILDRVQPALVFSSRYNGLMAEEFMQVSRQRGLPYVFHLDDNLMEVSPDQGADKVAYYNHPKRLQALRVQMEQASVAYFSTAALRDRMLELGINVAHPHVGPICAAVDLLPLPTMTPDGPLVFGYAASGGHNEDLKLALPGIVAALERFPQARFELIGSLEHLPAELQRFGARVQHERRFIPYDDYLRDLQRRNWSLGLTPLCDNPFTRMKTYTKWVEYTAAGLPVIASDHPIYRDCCAGDAARLVADGDWAAALPDLLADAPARQAILARARDRVGRDYSVARLRRQLFEVFARAGLTLPA